jgi:hypothetical protein
MASLIQNADGFTAITGADFGGNWCSKDVKNRRSHRPRQGD